MSPQPKEEAARWFLRLQEDDANAQTFLEWQRWLNASPEHRNAYDEIEQTALQLRAPISPPLPSPEELAEDDYDGSIPIAQWQQQQRPTRMRSSLRYALAASVALAVSITSFVLYDHYRAQYSELTYQTAAGERREFELPEGSRVTLDADSFLKVDLTPQQRSLNLARGEGYFRVAKNPNRPFTVRAGGAQVRAVGTAFNVRLAQDRTVVAVTEGKVEVTAEPALKLNIETAQLSSSPHAIKKPVAAGEAISYASSGELDLLPSADASAATSWLDGRRHYRNEPLRYVLADVRRYTGRQIDITDPAMRDLKFTGTVDIENIDAWLKALTLALPVALTEEPTTTPR
jgi:transmembrane sensor